MRPIDWYYKRANLSRVDEIINEFRAAVPVLYPEFDLNVTKAFFKAGVKNDMVKQLVPTLCEVLKGEGLYDSWTSTSFVCAHPDMQLNPHIDAPPSTNFPGRIFALNFPILNCENSVTSFYKCLTEIDFDALAVKSVNNNGSRYQSLIGYPIELQEQVTIDEPTWLRVDVPHGVTVVKGDQVRMTATLRFSPEPFEYLGVDRSQFPGH